MYDAQLMDVLDARQDLSVHLAALCFGQASVLDDVLEEFTARTVLHDQVEVVIVFNHL